jgi:glycosyltransferase involved in cell wall biosynthesis
VRTALVALGHPDHAGMLRALATLDDAAPRHGWSLRYVFAAPHDDVAAAGLPAARIAYLPALRGWRRWPAGPRLALAALRLGRLAREADLVYACTLSSFPPCRLAGRLAGRPQVVHVYSSYPDARSYRKHRLGRARHVIAPSADSLALARAAVGGFAPGTRAHVVYNGMDPRPITAAAAAEPPPELAADGVPSVGMVGNLDARKNPTCLIEALPPLRRAFGRVRALLVGAFRDARFEAQVRGRIAALGLADDVVVTGFLANPFPVVRGLDVLVHPARRDPFPLALLEGMALGRPIVASAVGGIPEMLAHDETGVLVPPDDPAALAEAVLGLLRDPVRRARLGAAARASLERRFSPAAFAAGMFGAFDQAVEECAT